MTNVAAAEKPKRGFWWWVTTVLAPIGIFGGPIAIADMLAGVIKWKGPIGYIVGYWDEKIGQYFHALFTYVAAFVGLPSLPEWLSDYFTLGILLLSSILRAMSLLEPDDWRKMLDEVLRTIGAWVTMTLRIFSVAIGSIAIFIASWPSFLLAPVFLLLLRRGKFEPSATSIYLLTFAPFAIFLVLFGINALMG